MDKLLIVTGASRGIGKASAQLFLAAGYRGINLSRSECDLDGMLNIRLDLSTLEWPAEIIQTLQQNAAKSAKVCLLHNAAILRKDNIENLAAEQLRQVLEVNVVAPQRLNKLLVNHMKPGSSILYLGSTLAEKAVANCCSYVISKHAGIGMMRSNCQDLAGREIISANVCPGFTDTEMLRRHIGDDQSVLTMISNKITHQRLLQPEEIAKILLFCAENSAINGAVLHANLGQLES